MEKKEKRYTKNSRHASHSTMLNICLSFKNLKNSISQRHAELNYNICGAMDMSGSRSAMKGILLDT